MRRSCSQCLISSVFVCLCISTIITLIRTSVKSVLHKENHLRYKGIDYNNLFLNRDALTSTITTADPISKPPSAPDGSQRLRFNYQSTPVAGPYTLPDPQVFKNNQTTIVLVLSGRENFERRRTIRETWANNHSVYFVVGGPILDITINPRNTVSQYNNTHEHASAPTLSPSLTEVQKKLEKEQSRWHDLIDSIHPDSYSSLTHKLRFGYNWTLVHLPSVEWIVKVDDDTMVRIDALASTLLQNLNPRVPIVVGRIIERSPVARKGKWTDELYPHAFYPYWPQGSCGHVVSRVVAQYVSDARSLVYYQGEDISLGIWLDESDLPTVWIHSDYFRNNKMCLKDDWLIMGHDNTEKEMRDCYIIKKEWSIDNLTRKNRRRYWVVGNLLERRRFGVNRM